MKQIVATGIISGSMKAPASKSSMQRAVAASLLSSGESVLVNPSLSNDGESSLSMASLLGATISRNDDSIIIKGGFKPGQARLDAGESGLGVRLFSALAALGEQEIIIIGSGSLQTRPMDMIVNSLRSMRVKASSNGGLLPLSIRGPLKGGDYEIDGSISSQFISGILMALPLTADDSTLRIKEFRSRRYVDLTLDVMREYGIIVRKSGSSMFVIPGNQVYQSCKYNVEGDWSGSAFFLVMAALNGNLEIHNLQLSSSQPDRDIIEILSGAGARVITDEKSVKIESSKLHPFVADVTECPDLAPPLVALAAGIKGRSVIKGTERLKVKESDRGETLKKEFSKLGVRVENWGNRLEVIGSGQMRGGEVSSNNDHRIAMALASVSVVTESPVIISDASAVDKSFPSFFEELNKVKLINQNK